ncbi:MAG TPA: hypothetical protein VFK68_05710 [Propionibacteriaceae bacterium]|nr:hypothetical protein [Propionibacteriaceae bacterium]
MRAQLVRPEPDLFAAPLVAGRAGTWVLLGFRTPGPHGVLALDLVGPIAARGTASPGAEVIAGGPHRPDAPVSTSRRRIGAA